MVGSHDNEPLSLWIESLFKKDEAEAHAQMLAEDLSPTDQREAEHLEKYKQDLLQEPKVLRKAKLAELFVSPAESVHVFFTDFFGIRDIYNKPGTCGTDNWSLRVPNDYEAFYRAQLEKDEAINLPEILLWALHAKALDLDDKNRALIAELIRLRSAGRPEA